MVPKETNDNCGDRFTLNTKRLVLRRPGLADAGALAVIANDWEIASNLATMPHPYNIRDADAFIRAVRPVKMPEAVLFISTRSDDRIIGCCSLRARQGAMGQARDRDCEHEIGYWLGRTSWGQGFATEAVHALVDFAFTGAGLCRLHVSCRVTNAASRRVIHKSGFQPDGADMIGSKALGGTVPVECYTLDRAIWRALREWRREGDHVLS